MVYKSVAQQGRIKCPCLIVRILYKFKTIHAQEIPKIL